jgi:hypothetical protein
MPKPSAQSEATPLAESWPAISASLTQYRTAVEMLVAIVETALQVGAIDPKLASKVEERLREVTAANIGA